VLELPVELTTARLVLRWPSLTDDQAVFAYAGDRDVTRYMAWPCHASIAETRAFLVLTLDDWRVGKGGAYLIEVDGRVVGSTGLHLRQPGAATTGYILAREVWGRGYATEACRAMVELGAAHGLTRVDAVCHADHQASARVLAKAGMTFEGVLAAHTVFPQLSSDPQDVRAYAWQAGGAT